MRDLRFITSGGTLIPFGLDQACGTLRGASVCLTGGSHAAPSKLRVFASSLAPPPLCRVEFHIDCFALPHIMCANHRRRRVAGESYGMLVVNCISGKNLSQCFKRATHADAGILGRVQVDFRCGYVRMTQQILDVADADAARQQVRRETVPQRVG